MKTILGLLLPLLCFALGCSDEFNPQMGPAGGRSDTTIVIGKPTPLVSDLTVWPVTSCTNTPINYVVSVQGGEPPYVYSVRTSDGQNRTLRSNFFVFDKPEEYQVYSTVTSHDGQVSRKTATVFISECGGSNPEPRDSLYVVKNVDLSVSPSDNDDHETVTLGLAKEITCDVYVYVAWRSPAESDMTFRIDDQPHALPHPMDGTTVQWIRFTGVKVSNVVNLGLTTDKGSVKRPDSGSDKKNANRITKVVFTTIGFREP